MEVERYAKITNGQIEFAPQNKGNVLNYYYNVELMVNDGYKPVVMGEIPNSYQKFTCQYVEEETRILVTWVYNDITLLDDIAQLKQQLASTDYKVIKCYEYALLDKELPYDMVLLAEERQKIRDKIQQLEEKVAPHLL